MHFVIQKEMKPKPIVTRSHRFSCATRSLHVFALGSDWLTGLSVYFATGQSFLGPVYKKRGFPWKAGYPSTGTFPLFSSSCLQDS